MKKLFFILVLAIMVCLSSYAAAITQVSNYNGAGYYQKINGSNSGVVGYFASNPTATGETWIPVTSYPGSAGLVPITVTATATANNEGVDVSAGASGNDRGVQSGTIHHTGIRSFPSGTEVYYPPFVVYMDQPTDGASVTSLEDFLSYGQTFSRTTFQTMIGSESVFGFLNPYEIITSPEGPKLSDEPPGETLITIKLKSMVKTDEFKRVATITVKATDFDITSEKLLALAGREAMMYEATEIHIIDSGKHRLITGYGWGIGLYYFGSQMSSSERSAGTGGGGTGYSYSETGYQDKPWVKVIAVKKQ